MSISTIEMATDDGIRTKTLKDVIRNFTPAWFAVNMGTGAISIIFHLFPYGADLQAMKITSLAFFLLNLILFILFSAVTFARYLLFPDVWSIMLQHPVQSLYVGTFPMGAATLISVAVSVVNGEFGFGGVSFLYFCWAAWWVDVLISVMCCWGMVHEMITVHDHALDRLTAAWLLPVVTLIVAASGGGILAKALQEHSISHALITASVSVVIVSIGLALAFMILTGYLLRLVVHGMVPTGTIISVFVPLGPCGQSGYAILLIGQFFRGILPLEESSSVVLSSSIAGEAINIFCTCVSFVLWSFATMWLVFALLAIQHVLRMNSKIPFKVPFWGLIFPNGVYANLTMALGQALDSPFFRVFGAIYATITIILWIGVSLRTITLVKSMAIFEAPCLEDIDIGKRSSPGQQVPTCTRAAGECATTSR